MLPLWGTTPWLTSPPWSSSRSSIKHTTGGKSWGLHPWNHKQNNLKVDSARLQLAPSLNREPWIPYLKTYRPMIKDGMTLIGDARSALVVGLKAGRNKLAKGHHVNELEPGLRAVHSTATASLSPRHNPAKFRVSSC